MFGRKSLLKKKYGITLDQYQELWDKQAGLCYICGLAERVNDRTGKVREYLSIDHNHVTGEIRSLLCHHCNTALGHVNENSAILQRMLEYVTNT